MDVTIIGIDNMARGIATRALAGGHTVTLLGHGADDADVLTAELPGDARTGTVGDPVQGDVVVLGVPYGALEEVVGRYEGRWDGRVVADIIIRSTSPTPISVPAGSAAQHVAEKAPGGNVKGVQPHVRRDARRGAVAGQPLDVLIAADDEDAKRAVSRLAEDGGLRAVDAGPSRAYELQAGSF